MSLPFESEYNTEIVTKPLKRVPWNKGLKGYMTEQQKDGIRKAHKGKVMTEATRQKLRDANLGKTMPQEQVEAWVKKMKAGNHYDVTPETRLKISNTLKARHASLKELREQ